MNHDDHNRSMTAAEVAAYLAIGRSTVYQLPIPYYLYGSRRVYELKDVLEYKESCRRVPIKKNAHGSSLSLQASPTTGNSALIDYFIKRGILDKDRNRIRKVRSKSQKIKPLT